MANTRRKVSVFISWSGLAGLSYAEFVREVFLRLFQGDVDIFVSVNIKKGKPFWNELRKNLRKANFGIVIVTPESLDSPWLHYEAGAMIDREPTPLLFDVAPEELPDTLRSVQATEFNIDELEKLIDQLAHLVGTKGIRNKVKSRLRELWPSIERCHADVRAIAVDLAGMPQERTIKDILGDIQKRLDGIHKKIVGSEYIVPDFYSHSVSARSGLPFTIVAGASSDNPTLALPGDDGRNILVEMGTPSGRKEFARFMRRRVLKVLRE